MDWKKEAGFNPSRTAMDQLLDSKMLASKSGEWIVVDKLLGPMAVEIPSGRKDDQDKPRMELLDGEFLEEVAKVLTFGAKKYAPHNWRGGIALGRLLGAAGRHLYSFIRGESVDAETGLSHLAHCTCCLMFAYWTLKHRPELDDRYKKD